MLGLVGGAPARAGGGDTVRRRFIGGGRVRVFLQPSLALINRRGFRGFAGPLPAPRDSSRTAYQLRLRPVTLRGPPYPSCSPRAHPSGWTRKASVSIDAMINFALGGELRVALVQGKRQPHRPFIGRCHQRLTHYSCEEPTQAACSGEAHRLHSLISKRASAGQPQSSTTWHRSRADGDRTTWRRCSC